jgi:HSP20 family protein
MAEKQKGPEKEESWRRTPGSIPFEDIERWLIDVFSRRWPRPFERGWPNWSEAWSELKTTLEGEWPKVDIIEREDEIVVRAGLPGVSKENIEVSVTDDNTVTIQATPLREQEEQGHYYRRELSGGEFQRTLTLPAEVKRDQAKASFKEGVLELTIPKLKPVKRKTIEVE